MRHPAVGKNPVERIQVWVTMATAVLALVLSIVTLVESKTRPDITMTLPSIVRFAQGDDVWFYLQPDFSVPTRSDATARITAIHLQRTRDGGLDGETPSFYWNESGDWTYDPVEAEFDL